MSEKDKLDLEKYPEEIQKSLKTEIEIVKKLVKKENKVIDVGCGGGRAMTEISPLVSEYVGVDIDEEYLSKARTLAQKFKNSSLVHLNAENLSDTFKENEFDKAFCLFNTVSCFKNYKKVLKEIRHIIKNQFYFSVCSKGSKNIREKYYNSIDVDVRFDKNETSHSKTWGQVKAFSENEIRTFCKEAGFKVKKISLIENCMYGVIAHK